MFRISHSPHNHSHWILSWDSFIKLQMRITCKEMASELKDSYKAIKIITNPNKKDWNFDKWDRKKNVPARPIDENHLSIQKQGLQGVLFSGPSIRSETLPSDPPLTTQRAFRERDRESQRKRKSERHKDVLWYTSECVTWLIIDSTQLKN